MVLTVGEGVGAGIVLDGSLVQGHSHAAGELGHVTVVDERDDHDGSQALRSEFLKSMRIADRLGMIPRGALVAPIGAALAVRGRPRASAMTEAVPWRS